MSLEIKRGEKFPSETGFFLVERLVLLKAIDCTVENKGPFHLGVPIFLHCLFENDACVCTRGRRAVARENLLFGRMTTDADEKFTVGKANEVASDDKSSRNGTFDFFIRFQNRDSRLLETHHLTRRAFRHWATSLCPMRRDRRLDLASISRATFRLHSRVDVRFPSRHEITARYAFA